MRYKKIFKIEYQVQAFSFFKIVFMKPIQFSLKGSKASSLSKMNQEKIATFAFGNTTKSKYQSVYITNIVFRKKNRKKSARKGN